jgi:hypothetical protein
VIFRMFWTCQSFFSFQLPKLDPAVFAIVISILFSPFTSRAQTTVTWERKAFGQSFRCDPADAATEWSYPNNNNWNQEEKFGQQCAPGTSILIEPSNWSSPHYPNSPDVNVVLGSDGGAPANLNVPVTVRSVTIQPDGGFFNMQYGSSLKAQSIEFQADTGITVSGAAGAAPLLSLASGGTILKSGGSGHFTLAPDLMVQTTAATINVQSGTLDLAGSGSTYADGTTFIAASEASIDLIPTNEIAIFSGLLTGSGAGTVRLNQGRMTAGSGGATLDFPTGLFQWFGGNIEPVGINQFTNKGSITMEGISGSSVTGAFVNEGMVEMLRSGIFAIAGGLHFNNSTGGIFDFKSDAWIETGYPQGETMFDNYGLLRKSAGSGESMVLAPLNILGGTVEADSGILTLSRGGHSSNATFKVNAGATVNLSVYGVGTTYEGLLRGEGEGTLQLRQGGLYAGPNGLTLDFPPGFFQLKGDGINGGSSEHSITNIGTITLSGAGVVFDGFFRNVGKMVIATQRFEDTLSLLPGASFNNLSGGVLELQNDSWITGEAGAPIFNNFGLVKKTAGSGETRIFPQFNLLGGTLQVHSGVIDPVRGSISSNATYIVSAGAGVYLGLGDTRFSGLITGNGAGTMLLEQGSIKASDAGVVLNMGGSIFQWKGGNIVSAADNGVTNVGRITILGPGTEGPVPQTFIGSFYNAGELIHQGSVNIPFGTIVRNLDEGTMNLQNDYPINGQGGLGGAPLISNEGLFVKSSGNGTNIIDRTITFQNLGTIQVNAGSLLFGQGYTQVAGKTLLSGGQLLANQPVNIQGGVFTGSGNVGANLANSGVVHPLNGTINVSGSFSQKKAGQLEIEIRGRQSGTWDQLIATNALLSGSLKIDLANGFNPEKGDKFEILHAGAVSGTFNEIIGANLPGGLVLVPTYNNNSVVLVANAALAIGDFQLAGQKLSLNFQTENGKSYEIQSNDDLNLPAWKTFQTITGNGTTLSASVTITNLGNRFFRIFAP